jgi:hypothetical protein
VDLGQREDQQDRLDLADPQGELVLRDQRDRLVELVELAAREAWELRDQLDLAAPQVELVELALRRGL